MFAGRAAEHLLGLPADGEDLRAAAVVWTATTEGSHETIPLPLT